MTFPYPLTPEVRADLWRFMGLPPEAAANAGRYLRRSMQRSVSHTWNSGGREYYRNKAGRCEDAPCCGCCNA